MTPPYPYNLRYRPVRPLILDNTFSSVSVCVRARIRNRKRDLIKRKYYTTYMSTMILDRPGMIFALYSLAWDLHYKQIPYQSIPTGDL